MTTTTDPDGVEPGALVARDGVHGETTERRSRRVKRVSMHDVAQLAGVSSQTVSRVSNGTGDVVAATRDRVLSAMQELGYRPNGAARALKSGEFRTLGVILFSLSTTGNVRTLEAIADSAANEGYAITLLPVAPTQAKMTGAFDRLSELAVDAVIVIMEVHLLDVAQAALPPGIKMVVVDSGGSDRYCVVDTDQEDGARKAVCHLLDLGHETVWHVTGPNTSFASERRAHAWRETLEAEGRPTPEPLVGDWSAESGYRAGLRLAEIPECTAVFAANDQMALGLLRAFQERGRLVPEQVSVVGFDDGPDAGSYFPPLTTIRQDFKTVGQQSVARAIQQIRTNETPQGALLVSTELVVRASTGPPPGH